MPYPLSTSWGEVPVTVKESGAGGRPVLLLHGGAGPDSVTGFGGLLASRFPFRVLSPVYPGFTGTTRPGWLDSIGKLAGVCRGLLEHLDLTGVIVAGSSIGGWVAAELALAAPERVGRLVLMDPAGLDSADHPIADFFSLTPDEVAELSWANPEGHRIDPAAMSEAQRAILAGNREALLAYGGRAMADPGLAARLGPYSPCSATCSQGYAPGGSGASRMPSGCEPGREPGLIPIDGGRRGRQP